MSEKNKKVSMLCPRCMHSGISQEICPHCGFDRRFFTGEIYHLPEETILNGRYLTGIVLGEGGNGIVYAGYDLLLQLRVTIKEYYPSGLLWRDCRRSQVVSLISGNDQNRYDHGKNKFLESARLMARFDSDSGIVDVRDYFLENGTAYIVLEYVGGGSLAEIASGNTGGRLSFHQVLQLMSSPIRSLACMHQMGIYHLDINPENMILTDDGVVKLIDFDTAASIETYTESTWINQEKGTKIREGFSAPEMYMVGEKKGYLMDIYSLSASIYRLITGIVPPSAMERLKKDRLLPPREMGVKDMDLSQESSLLKGLALNPAERWESVTDMYEALKRSDKIFE